jgi:hypothetical protein
MRSLGGLFALILLFGGGWLVLDGAVAPGSPFAASPGDDPSTSVPSDDPSDEPSDGPGDESGCDPSPGRVVADYLYGQGFKKSDFVVGAQVIDWGRLDTGHTHNPFSEPLQSESAVRTFLSNDNRAARAARDVAPVADDYVPVQFSEGIRYSENWHWDGRKAVKGGDLWVRSGGDVWWMAVDDDCEVVEDSSIRAICGNPGVFWLRPEVDPRD